MRAAPRPAPGKVTAEAAELRKAEADRPESMARRGFAAVEGQGENCGRTAERLRKCSDSSPPVEALAPSLGLLPCPKLRESDLHQPPTGRETEAPQAARVLTHPAFDRSPVVNPRRRGPMGAITLDRERRRRDRHAREAAEAARWGRPPHDVAAELRGNARACVGAAREARFAADDAVIAEALAVLDGRLRRPGVVMSDPGRVRQFLTLELAQRDTEGFGVLFIDAQHAVIAFELMFEGTLSQTSVYPREVARRALALNAAAVILAHNHPSGCPEPSRADQFLTSTLRTALAMVDVKVLDHLIVGRLLVVSMAERGMV